MVDMAQFGPNESFEENNFDKIYETYFEDMIAQECVAADPSGWARTEPGAQMTLEVPMPPELLGHYVVDNRKLIAPQKEKLKRLFSEWDGRDYLFDEITLAPSISAASLATLLLLRSVGVRRILFETPAYYAVLDQAELFGFETELVATHACHQYRWQPSIWAVGKNEACAFWITQPRYGLGINQNADDVAALLADIGPEQFLVIDETADQCWPSVLSSIQSTSLRGLIKIRGIMKPLGLNGLRLAAILHAPCWRLKFQELLWLVGAALDRYSLIAAEEIAETPHLFATMLQSARQRIVVAQRLIAAAAHGKPLVVSSMENGYLGVVEIDWEHAAYRRDRAELLAHCRQARMPVTLGPAMIFARDESRERIRLNYFMPRQDLEYCISQLAAFTGNTR
jgi:histidinol-phosphate/aromatic aminotransferase/cobyric acid decarboxylase-like protein